MTARREAVETYLAEHHWSLNSLKNTGHGSWHLTLNNHASMRANALGGPLVRAVTQCKTHTRVAPGCASASWLCSLDLPNTFTPADGRRLQTEGSGTTHK